MKDAKKTPLRSHISEAKAKIAKEHPDLVAGYQQFLASFNRYLETRRQFDSGVEEQQRLVRASRVTNNA